MVGVRQGKGSIDRETAEENETGQEMNQAGTGQGCVEQRTFKVS
jgi:hypothetical protein